MRFVTPITIFAVTSRLLALATAKPVPNLKAGGMAIPLARHSSFPNSNKSVDLNEINSHGISIREKILSGLDNYEMNTGTMHPFAVKRRELGLAKRGASLPLTSYRNTYWMGQISIGTPAKTLNVQIDTGAADLWVLQTGCIGTSEDRDLWDPDSSESAKKQGETFQFNYADGDIVKGDQYTDNVTIAGFTADPQIFGSATSYTAQSRKTEYQYYADGLLGLAFPSVSKFRGLMLFESLASQKKLINPTFSLKLSPSGAEMYVGGANSMLYNGDIAYIPVTNPGFWQVTMDDVRVSGNKILENVPVIFDTGANHIFGDWERVSELYRQLGGTLVNSGNFGLYYLPCDSFPTLSLTFGGKSFAIPPEVLNLGRVEEGSPNCFSTIIAPHSPTTFWTVGIPFLQDVYSVFDYTSLQVGFANLA